MLERVAALVPAPCRPLQELQRRAAGTACADAQVTTLRERVLKLAVWVERSVRRIVLHLPTTFSWLPTRRIARAGAALLGRPYE